MNQIFESNIEILAKKNRALANAIVSPDIEPVQIEKAKTGEYTFKYNGKYFHSPYDPLKEAGKYVEEIIAKDFNWVLLFGMGCGYIPKLLIDKGKEKIVVYEASVEILKGVLSCIDLKEMLSKDFFYLCHTMEELGNIVRNYTDAMDNLLAYQTIPYRLAFSEELKIFTNTINNAYTTNKIKVQTEIVSRLMWVDNYLANLKNFARYKAVDAMKDRFYRGDCRRSNGDGIRLCRYC